MFRAFQVLAVLLTLLVASPGRAGLASSATPQTAATDGLFQPFAALEPTGTYEDAPPIGLEPRIGLLCHNDPVNKTDPSGLLDVIIEGSSAFKERVMQAMNTLYHETEMGKYMLERDGTLIITADRSELAPFVSDSLRLDAKSPIFIGKDAPIRNDAPEEIPKGSDDKVRAAVLGHELGHDVLGYDDVTKGEKTPNNVRDVENPIRKDLGLEERKAYHGKPFVTPD